MTDWMGTDQYGWLVLIVAFLVLEFKALFNKERGDTWSEVVRYIFGFSKRQTSTSIWRPITFWVLSAWFVAHIAFGI